MINKEFFQALDDLEKEQRIPKESMIESIEAGLVSAYKKEYGFASQISVRLNEEKMTYKVYAHKLVVDEVEDEESQISLEDAQDIDKKYKVGDVVIEDITPKDFSRIAAQTAKQVILQRINDYKKELVLNEMSERTGEILSAIVRRKEGNTVYVEITGTQMEGVMMQQDQVPTETYNVNDVIKVYVKKFVTVCTARKLSCREVRQASFADCSNSKFPKSRRDSSKSTASFAKRDSAPNSQCPVKIPTSTQSEVA